METPRPYQTRERLFYQADAAVTTTAQPKDSPLKPQSPTREFVIDQVPQGSLYDSVLEPASPYKPPPAATVNEVRSEVTACEDGWVTVFGFPSGKSNVILQLFKQLGPVEEHEPGHGNWLHLRYASPWTVQRALAKNGTLCTVDTTGCLIGVIPRSQVENVLQHEPKQSSVAPLMEISLNREPNVFSQPHGDQPMVQRLLKSVFGL